MTYLILHNYFIFKPVSKDILVFYILTTIICNVDNILEKYTPDLIIIELGGNDGLRGFPTKLIKSNLNKIIKTRLNAVIWSLKSLLNH